MRAAVNCKLLHCADGTALLASGIDISETERVLSLELEDVSGENRLSLHLGKTVNSFWLNLPINNCFHNIYFF